MASYTPNLNLYKPDATDDFGDFREEFNNNMDKLDQGGGGGGDSVTWTQIQQSGTKIAEIDINGTSQDVYAPQGGGSGGHTIYDENGTALTQENGLQFTGAVSVSDDNVNGRTVVDILGGGGSGMNYSTNEQVIGTWIDGKPLYEITLNPTVNRGSNTLNHGIANFKECIRIFGKCKYNNTVEVLSLPYVSTNTQYVITCGNVTPTTYLVETGLGFSSIQDCYVTIQYTKTTD